MDIEEIIEQAGETPVDLEKLAEWRENTLPDRIAASRWRLAKIRELDTSGESVPLFEATLQEYECDLDGAVNDACCVEIYESLLETTEQATAPEIAQHVRDAQIDDKRKKEVIRRIVEDVTESLIAHFEPDLRLLDCMHEPPIDTMQALEMMKQLQEGEELPEEMVLPSGLVRDHIRTLMYGIIRAPGTTPPSSGSPLQS